MLGGDVYFIMRLWFCNLLVISSLKYTTSSPSFSLRDSRASETRARVKIVAFLAWGDFDARSRFTCSIIPEEKVRDYS